jgi:hypothetical protein
LVATEAEIATLPPPADRQATDIDSEVEAALALFDEIERLAEMPMTNEAINAMLERTDGTINPPGRSPKGLFRLVHNRE